MKSEVTIDNTANVQAYYEAMDTLQSNWFRYIHDDTILPTAAETIQNGWNLPTMTFTETVEFSDHVKLIEVVHNGDILVGIHLPPTAPEPITIRVEVGGTSVSQLSLFPGSKHLIFDNATCCHLDTIVYHRMNLRLLSGTGLVSCTLIYHNVGTGTSIRRLIAMTNHVYLIPAHLRTEYTRQCPLITMSYGMLGMGKGKESDIVAAVKEGAYQLPDIWKVSRPASNWWHIPGGPCMQRVAKLKEELMASAWHPRRMVEWCWDDEERREFQMTIVTKTEPHRLWYDEVLVTDGLEITRHIKGLESLKLDRGQRVRFVATTGRGFVTVCGKHDRFICFDAEKPFWIEQCM